MLESWSGICCYSPMWSSAWRSGYIVVGVWSYYHLGHSLGIFFLFIIVGSLCPMWSSFAILCFDRSRTFPYPLPLLLLKPCSSPCTTTFFLSFPHSLAKTCTHLPLTFPFVSPFSRGIHRLCTPEFYYSRCIFIIPFSQTSILIDNCRDNKNLPLGPLKNSLSTSL